MGLTLHPLRYRLDYPVQDCGHSGCPGVAVYGLAEDGEMLTQVCHMCAAELQSEGAKFKKNKSLVAMD